MHVAGLRNRNSSVGIYFTESVSSTKDVPSLKRMERGVSDRRNLLLLLVKLLLLLVTSKLLNV